MAELNSAMMKERGAVLTTDLPDFKEEIVQETSNARDEAIASKQAAEIYANEAESAAASVAGSLRPSQLRQLRQSLENPLCQFIGLVLMGDSITWGMSATGIASITPRNQSLTDARNNGTSLTWANLMHKELGLSYYDTATAAEGAWPGSPSGVATFTYSKLVALSPIYAPFSYENRFSGANRGLWTVSNNASASLVAFLNATTTSPQDDMRLSFEMTGYAFTIVFAALPNGARYTVSVDGVSIGEFSTNSTDLGIPVAWGVTREHEIGGFKSGARIEIRVVAGLAGKDAFRLEAVRVNRTLRFTNQGLIGTNARQWAASLAAASLREGDTFAFIQLGTNDRGQVFANSGQAQAQNALGKNLRDLLNLPSMATVRPVLLCANAVTDNAPPAQKFTMGAVRAEIARIATERNVSFVDQYAATVGKIGGTPPLLADGLHPNDAGHKIMFDNLFSRFLSE